ETGLHLNWTKVQYTAGARLGTIKDPEEGEVYTAQTLLRVRYGVPSEALLTTGVALKIVCERQKARPERRRDHPANAAPSRKNFSAVRFAALGFVLFLSACATPIGVTRLDTQQAQQLLTANALSAGAPSSWSSQVLHRNGLYERYWEDPAATLAGLHELMKEPVEEGRLQDRLFALAELSFL